MSIASSSINEKYLLSMPYSVSYCLNMIVGHNVSQYISNFDSRILSQKLNKFLRKKGILGMSKAKLLSPPGICRVLASEDGMAVSRK